MDGPGHFAALSRLLEDGVGLLVGTTDAQGVPRAGRAWGVRLDGDRVRVVVGADDPAMAARLESGRIAVTGADVRALRSAQLKGRVCAVEDPDQLDLAAADVQTELFFAAIEETDGTGYELTSRLLPRTMVTVVMEVSEGFDQTPGPGAGAPLREAMP